jgi:hypothetical protein
MLEFGVQIFGALSPAIALRAIQEVFESTDPELAENCPT